MGLTTFGCILFVIALALIIIPKLVYDKMFPFLIILILLLIILMLAGAGKHRIHIGG